MSDGAFDPGAEPVPEASPLDRPQADGPTGKAPWLLAVVAHGAVAVAAFLSPSAPPAPPGPPALVSRMIEVDLEPEPEPEPEPEAVPEPEPPAPPKPVRRPPPPPKPVVPPPPEPEPVPEPEAPAPEAAQAAEVLTAEPETRPPEPAPDTAVNGNAAEAPGGYTAAQGTGTRAAHDPRALALGVRGGTGSAAADRSRPPRLAGGAVWDCPWPDEGELAGEDAVTVTLRVRVSQAGAVQQVTVEDDPGFGFGREARRCALRKRWEPARDRSGRPIAQVARVAVQFVY